MPKNKNQLLATILAAIPGLGHFYLGLFIRGVVFLGVFILILIAPIFFPENFTDNPLFSIVAPTWIVSLVVVYIWNIIDARQKTDYLNLNTSAAAQALNYKKIIWAVPIIV